MDTFQRICDAHVSTRPGDKMFNHNMVKIEPDKNPLMRFFKKHTG
jgi:hypothetical protein